tara:strand:- start:3054 stop:4898 length:1845 start_codon:yes stop_codon:yes gene_type:complete
MGMPALPGSTGQNALMLRTPGVGRHLTAGLAVVGVSALSAFGAIGSGNQGVLRPEHFDAKQVTITPSGGDGIRIREVVDIDFGLVEKRGYERIVPNDFGVPIDVTAFSPDANDDVSASSYGSDTRIRVGDPNIVFTGQHRYELAYTLPEAQVSGGLLAVNVIGNTETFVTDRFEVVLSGFELTEPRCDTGLFGDFGGCEFAEQPDGSYVAVINDLQPGEGISVGGTIESAVPTAFAGVPQVSDRNPTGIRPLGLLAAALSTVVVVGVFVAARRAGSNEVRGAGGAADAAYGDLPMPRSGDPLVGVPTYRVPDSRLADLATIEFVPPRGVEPWQARVLLSEQIDDDSVAAWFSEMIARDAILIEKRNGDDVMRQGPNTVRLSAVDQGHLATLFASGPTVELGSYDSAFSSAWRAVQTEQRRFIADSGWWSNGSPGQGMSLNGLGRVLIPFVFIVLVSGSSLRIAGLGLAGAVGNWFAALIFTALLVGLIAFWIYRSMLPSRSATGSALTLRAESFRRFLAASEGRHVEWAWDNGLLREYSAWAVALGAAEAWTDAVKSSNIAEPELVLGGPLLLYLHPGSFSSTHTQPSSSGSSGGFGGGGGVGGGGGGGSSGSW